jgi:hypothetical protein
MENVKRAIFLVVLLFASTGVTFVAGQSLGWWQLDAGKIFVAAGALALSIVALLPALNAAERRQDDRPELRWLWLLMAFLLTGVVTFVVGEWLFAKGR